MATDFDTLFNWLLLQLPHLFSEESSAKDSTSNDTSTRPQDAPGSGSSDGPKVPTTGTSSAEFAAEAERLEGPTSGVCTASDLDIALGVITQQCGSGQRDAMSGQRGAMISTAAAAWPDDAAGVLALLLLEDVVLERGQACLIPAGCPHAYICGKMASKPVWLLFCERHHLPMKV